MSVGLGLGVKPLGRASKVPFNPADLGSTLVRWWDAGQYVYNNDAGGFAAADGDNVHVWKCRNDITKTAARDTSGFPVYKTGIINGKPVLRHVSGSYMAQSPAISASTTYSIFCALNFTGTATYKCILTIPNRIQLYARLGGTTWGAYINADRSAGVVLSTSSWYVLSVTVNSYNDIKMYTNGGSMTNNTAAAGWDTYAGASLSRSGSSSFLGDIAEILICDTVLSDSNRQGVEGYLNDKYGIY